MIWASKDSELRCRLAARCINNPGRYKQLAEWFDCYQYVVPGNRFLNSSWNLVQFETPSDVFKLWLFLDMLYVCFYVDEQDLIWKLINEF